MTQLISFTLSLPSGYLNVLVNSQWRTCWCLIKNGQLWFYQDKSKNKVSQPAVTLEGCSVSADPSPEHLYSFRIEMDGTQLATLEVDHSCLQTSSGIQLSRMTCDLTTKPVTKIMLFFFVFVFFRSVCVNSL